MTDSIKKLKDLCLEYNIKKYPNLPNYARIIHKYTDRTANCLTKCIVDYCKFSGHFAERSSNEGRIIDSRKSYTDAIGRTRKFGDIKRIPSSGTLGTSDIKAVISGRMVAIEVKIGKDRQSEAQKNYQKKVEAAGGLYWIVRTLDEFQNKLENI